ncbi:MAG TPA: peptidoglycan DD-metalloendopeptidase family protein [Solimonas sp.]|nr:peptidoglycan DD-metalloendopeptidase family protein [Solimonas sp.]
MKLDYSPAELAPRRSARRSVVFASLSLAMLAAVAAHKSIATRGSPLQGAASAEVAAAFSAEDGSAFDGVIQAAVGDALEAPPASTWQVHTVRRGQTLSDIFEAEGLARTQALAVVALSKDAARLKGLRAGDKLHFRKNAEMQLEELSYELDEAHTLQVRRNEADELEALTIAAEIERRVTQSAGLVESSLFMAGQKAGLSNRLVMELAALFNYDVDFALDLREGDRFAVVYDELYRNGEKLRDGDIIAAEFVNQGKVHRAMRYVDVDGNVAYYTPEGQSLRKAFIRTPVDFARISSGFNPRRRHPILNTIRAHKGVDYAASTGTPVKATGDGRVEFIGMKSGYGRVIVLKHGTRYTTLYAHLSRYRSGLSVGTRVKQGQVIGYVGSSGLATAPHLHYEFRINGAHQNPMTVALPRANPLPRSVVARWRGENAYVLAQLESLSKAQVAQKGGGSGTLRLNP